MPVTVRATSIARADGAATSTSIVPPPPSLSASSCSDPCATISPRWITSSRSQVWLISERMWLESSTVCSPFSARIVARISTICTGSRPLVGSSRISSLGLCTSAWATPTRCR